MPRTAPFCATHSKRSARSLSRLCGCPTRRRPSPSARPRPRCETCTTACRACRICACSKPP
nr:MAG TPA: hypothetical protein [Caudoviricetes sp.]